ncbi:MAG: sulfurtransferase [Polaromonas sp.]|uniref:rhodanese-like domain-containing protein n=1 Tax=Polaromonas sp. TaxID=1869339 RepID=UPI0017A5D3CF|nr:rhodanese-like domain-containing protein [Polaromonas sp.]NMM11132.1 sulfurtransferase [Polaromonas sp.]
MISQLSPSQFTAWRDTARTPVVLDVREPWELQTASVKEDGFTLVHIPMRDIPTRLDELQNLLGTGQPIACLCHHGMRSLQVANYLMQSGFTEVVNLQGGINAWSQQVDPSVPLY